MEIGRAFSIFGNLAIPVCGAAAGIVSADIRHSITNPTGVSVIVGSALFGLITGSGLGERSHRYVGGVVAQAIPFFLGMALHNPRAYDYAFFELGRFFFASTVSITAQIFFRELRHLPEAFNKGGGNGSSHASSRSVREAAREENSEDSDGKPSSALIPFGVGNQAASGTLSTFVPRMEGLQVADPGSVIIGVEQEVHTRRHLLEGNTTVTRRKFKTAEGGSLEEDSYEHSGWLGSETKSRREYKAGSGTYGNATSPSGEKDPKIEELED